MRISTKGRYALRLMLELTFFYKKRLVSLKEIASRQGISEKYLEQIIMRLNHGGLVKSVRGSKGGYCLALPPSEITVGNVLRIMEGSLAPVECLTDPINTCPRANDCITVKVWEKLNEAIIGVVDSISLADLVSEAPTSPCHGDKQLALENCQDSLDSDSCRDPIDF